jgi:hypothetical protein
MLCSGSLDEQRNDLTALAVNRAATKWPETKQSKYYLNQISCQKIWEFSVDLCNILFFCEIDGR